LYKMKCNVDGGSAWLLCRDFSSGIMAAMLWIGATNYFKQDGHECILLRGWMGVALMKPRTRVVVCGRCTLNLLEHRLFPVGDKAENTL